MDRVDGNEGGEDVDGTSDDNRVEGSVAAEADGLEENGHNDTTIDPTVTKVSGIFFYLCKWKRESTKILVDSHAILDKSFLSFGRLQKKTIFLFPTAKRPLRSL